MSFEFKSACQAINVPNVCDNVISLIPTNVQMNVPYDYDSSNDEAVEEVMIKQNALSQDTINVPDVCNNVIPQFPQTYKQMCHIIMTPAMMKLWTKQ